MELNNIEKTTTWGEAADAINGNFVKIQVEVGQQGTNVIEQTFGNRTDKTVSQKVLTDEFDKHYESIGFAGQLEADVEVQPPSGVPVDGNSTNVFYHKGKYAFVINSGNNYYTEWNNSARWNGSDYRARKDVYYLLPDGTQYVFTGSGLQPTGESGSSSSGDIKSVVFTEIDSLNTIDKCGYYNVTKDGENCGALIVTSDYMAHGVIQFLVSNYIINTSGQIDGTHNDNIATIIYRHKMQSAEDWSVWSYFPINDKGSSYFTTFSSKHIEELIKKTGWETVQFASVLDGSETIQSIGKGEVLTSEDVFYSPKQGAFVGRVFDGLVPKYYGDWGNDELWNDNVTGTNPRKKVYFIASDGTQYTYDGELKPTGAEEEGGNTTAGGVKEITSAELDTTVAGGVYMIKDSTQIVMMQVSVSTIDSDVYVTQYLFESDGNIKKRTRKNAESWGDWEYHKQEAGSSEKDTMSQKAITDLVGQLQVPVGFNTFITEQITIEEVGSSGTGTKDNVYYYNYGTYHKFVMLHTDGKYYDQFIGQESYMADFTNPKTNIRFIDITGQNYYYDGSKLVSLGFADPIVYIYGKYDDAASFTETAKKLLAANFFFAKIEVKIAESTYVQVFFNGKLVNDYPQSSIPALLVGVSAQGKDYRMIGLGTDYVEIEEIV